MTNLTTVPALVLRRVYDAPVDRVFDAWTDPALAAQFLGPWDVVADVAMDARPGGAYRITMHRSNGEDMIASGTFKEVERPHRLTMTWQWDGDEQETLLTIELFDREGATELVLTHAQFASEESRNNHETGWSSIIRKLAGFLDSGVCVEADDEDGIASASVVLPAMPDRVFHALASEDVTRWWVRPGIFDTRSWHGDVRVGGTFEASGLGRGEPYAVTGTFLVVESPRLLEHTWQMSGAGEPTTVRYRLEPFNGGTRLVLRHSGIPSPDICESLAAAWGACFERLLATLKTG